MSLGPLFWRFASAAVLANLADGIRVAAFPLLAASLTDEPAAVGAVAAAAALPWLLTGLLAGSLADRRGARTLLVGADVARVAVLVVLVGALVLDRASLPLVVAAAFALGIGETLRDTAAQTVVPRLVPTALLERANGRLVAGQVVGDEVLGPLAGGALFALGAALPFAVDSAALAVAVLLVITLPRSLLDLRDAGARAADPVPSGAVAGLAWLARHRLLRALVLTGALVSVADSAWFAVLVLYAEQRLSLGPFGFGVLLATGAVGGLAGAVLADRLVGGHRHRVVLGWSFTLTAGTPALLLLAPGRVSAAMVVVVTSASFGVLNVAAVSLRQRLVPEGLLGRVTAAWRTLVQGGAAVGALVGGQVGSVAGLDAPFVFSAGVAVVATVLWWGSARPRPA